MEIPQLVLLEYFPYDVGHARVFAKPHCMHPHAQFYAGPYNPMGFGGGPYDPTQINPKHINCPYNCKLGQPLKKCYAVKFSQCQGIFWTWPKSDHFVHQVSNAKHEAFKSQFEVEQWLMQVTTLFGPIPSHHRQNWWIVGEGFVGHMILQCPCYDAVYYTNGEPTQAIQLGFLLAIGEPMSRLNWGNPTIL